MPLTQSRARCRSPGAGWCRHCRHSGASRKRDAAAQHLAEDRAGEPADLDHDRGRGGRGCCARRRRSRPTSRRRACSPDEVRLRMSIGHVQKTLGRRRDSEASYKAALALDPGIAEAYWSLADLKNYTFSDAEVAAMQGLLRERPAGRARTRRSCISHSARPSSSARSTRQAFAHYAQGNALRRLDAPFDIESFERRSARIRAVLRRAVLRRAPRQRRPEPGARSSSSACRAPVRRSSSRSSPATRAWKAPWSCRTSSTSCASSKTCRANRDGYPESARQRSRRRSCVPSARATSRRPRHCAPGASTSPTSCPTTSATSGSSTRSCPTPPSSTRAVIRWIRASAPSSSTSPRDRPSATTSSDLGRYYRCYLSLMDHWDAVLPGKVLHVQYEELVRDPEANIRRLLEHCGLAFEPACLNFHETRALGAHGERRAGAPAAVHLGGRLLATLRAGA